MPGLSLISGRSRSRRGLLVRVASALVTLGVIYVLLTFWQVWSASRHDDPRPSAAIVVLGAAQYDGTPSPVLQDRLDTALELWRNGVAPVIVTTGANQLGDRFTEAESGAAYLFDHGVPEASLIAVPIGTNTWEELAATSEALTPRGWVDVVLVSDPYHAYRINRIADEVGLDATVVSTPGSASFARLVRETAGASVGRLVGYRRLTGFG